ncbi:MULTISPECIES: MFS transporter [Shouchella]|uniref:MFS transporter n=1 Tax=Shouchella rhizosphaerae TaxID=866786 RepID=A0ABZ2D0P6_9BACI|nr:MULTISPECIES: MFS transporter [Shouchella]MDO7283730.1 MFS transporter [Shouchella clausii]MDO7303826.1 MFS transporter [Shouchella clausii]PAF08355.1 MFS transporter [Shouchella clausii]SHM00322.1 Predicted arabinose efflux permease, MFS family [Shouchella rhizosphaerae]
MAQQPSLFKNSRFILLFLGSFLAIIGFSMFFMTTTWFVISDLGSASSLGIILIAITVPRILMMAFGGVLADKFKKTTIMFSTSFIQGVLLVIIFLLNNANQLTFEYLIILGFFFGTLDAFSGPAGTSLIPKMVQKNQIKQANAVIQGLGQIGFIVGPMISGSVMEYAGVTTGYFVSAIIVLLSAFFMFPPFLKEGPVDNTVKQTPLKDLIEGFSYVKASKFLLTGILILITLNFFAFGAISIAIPILVETYGGSPINLSYIEAALGVGMLVSTAIIGIVKIRRRGLTSIAGLIATLFVAIAFSQIPNLYILTALAFLIGFTMTFVSIPFFTSAQEDTDPRIMGKVMSIVFLAMNGFDPLAYASVTFLVSKGIDVQHVILSFSIVGLMIALITLWKGKTYKSYTSNY